MLTLELSSFILEIPNDAYTTLSQSDWLFNTQSRVLQADRLMLENNEKATLNINMPYFCWWFVWLVSFWWFENTGEVSSG